MTPVDSGRGILVTAPECCQRRETAETAATRQARTGEHGDPPGPSPDLTDSTVHPPPLREDWRTGRSAEPLHPHPRPYESGIVGPIRRHGPRPSSCRHPWHRDICVDQDSGPALRAVVRAVAARVRKVSRRRPSGNRAGPTRGGVCRGAPANPRLAVVQALVLVCRIRPEGANPAVPSRNRVTNR